MMNILSVCKSYVLEMYKRMHWPTDRQPATYQLIADHLLEETTNVLLL